MTSDLTPFEAKALRAMFKLSNNLEKRITSGEVMACTMFEAFVAEHNGEPYLYLSGVDGKRAAIMMLSEGNVKMMAKAMMSAVSAAKKMKRVAA